MRSDSELLIFIFRSEKRMGLRTQSDFAKSDPVLIKSNLRLHIMRSNSELLVFIFRSEKRMGLLMQSDFAKSDGINLIWESDGPSRQILAQNPTTPPSDSQIEKWHRSLIK